MTTPVNIDVSPTGGRTMSFVMPKDIPAGEAPIPRDPRVNVNDVPTELLAVREFPGDENMFSCGRRRKFDFCEGLFHVKDSGIAPTRVAC